MPRIDKWYLFRRRDWKLCLFRSQDRLTSNNRALVLASQGRKWKLFVLHVCTRKRLWKVEFVARVQKIFVNRARTSCACVCQPGMQTRRRWSTGLFIFFSLLFYFHIDLALVGSLRGSKMAKLKCIYQEGEDKDSVNACRPWTELFLLRTGSEVKWMQWLWFVVSSWSRAFRLESRALFKIRRDVRSLQVCACSKLLSCPKQSFQVKHCDTNLHYTTRHFSNSDRHRPRTGCNGKCSSCDFCSVQRNGLSLYDSPKNGNNPVVSNLWFNSTPYNHTFGPSVQYTRSLCSRSAMPK